MFDARFKRRECLVVLILVLFLFNLVFTSVVVDSGAVRCYISTTSMLDVDYGDYIVKFRNVSLSVFVSKLLEEKNVGFLGLSAEGGVVKKKINDYRDMLLSVHEKAKEDILRLIEKYSVEGVSFSYDFIDLFNGVALRRFPGFLVEKISDLPYVDRVLLDYRVEGLLDDSVSLIEADEVWGLHDSLGRNVTGEGVSVAVLDTGVDYNHPVLGGGFGPGFRVVGGYDFVTCNHFDSNGVCLDPKPEDSDPMDDNGHGTHVAGIILGVAPNVSLYAFKVLNMDGEGKVSWAMKGLERALDPDGDHDFSDHVDVVSMSLGSEEPGDPDDTLCLAVDNAVRCGVVVVAAAGNLGVNGKGTITSPGCARKVICVGSSDKNDKVSPSSSQGPTGIGMVKPDVVAPGVGINSTWLNGGYRVMSGTSMACPHVAGTAALILQMHPGWTLDEVKMALRGTAVDLGYDVTVQGFGRINALKAVSLQTPPPVAILNTSGEFKSGVINLSGTAVADDLQNYTLWYYDDGWVKIFEGYTVVVDDVLCRWDTTSIVAGETYMLKLEVDTVDQKSMDFVFITLKGENEPGLFIDMPSMVNETESFTVKVTDEKHNPVRCFILFFIPFHLPRIMYGSNVTFKAPVVLNPFVKQLDGRIVVLKLAGFQTCNQTIIVVNQGF